jgi:hypothetical protein
MAQSTPTRRLNVITVSLSGSLQLRSAAQMLVSCAASRREGPTTEPEFACEEDDITSRADAELGRDFLSTSSQFRRIGEQFLPKPATTGRAIKLF